MSLQNREMNTSRSTEIDNPALGNMSVNSLHIEELNGHDLSKNEPDDYRARLLPKREKLQRMKTAKRQKEILVDWVYHSISTAIGILILVLNIRQYYWQDFGHPYQDAFLQAFQYAAKAHDLLMVISVKSIITQVLRYLRKFSENIPIDLLIGGFRLGSPGSLFLKIFREKAGVHANKFGLLGFFGLLSLGFFLTAFVGPSSAIIMIPRLNWWDVTPKTALGGRFNDRLFFNRTETQLWPQNVTQEIYAKSDYCDGRDMTYEDCAIRAWDIVRQWAGTNQREGSKPNITVYQDIEVSRMLTSVGGPPDQSSWTVTSTVGSEFTRDLIHYWTWLEEKSDILKIINRPVIKPKFKNPQMKVKKPLVQTQCSSYFDPDWDHDVFEFPHNELLTPPLDQFKENVWSLPNQFVMNLKRHTNSSKLRFDWFDTASNFSDKGAPSLGGVLIYRADDGTSKTDALAACSFDSRWVPVEYYLDPVNSMTVNQDSPNPMDILNGSQKAKVADLIQMKLTLDWANSMNIPDRNPSVPGASLVESLLGFFGEPGVISSHGDKSISDPNPRKSLDWRLSTTLGLYLTEGLARAFQDVGNGTMIYHQTFNTPQPFLYELNDVNNKILQEGYSNGTLDWVPRNDPRWNDSMDSWDKWAIEHGYTEMVIEYKRYGYGYGFQGLPIKFATAALGIYILLVGLHVLLQLSSRYGSEETPSTDELLSVLEIGRAHV